MLTASKLASILSAAAIVVLTAAAASPLQAQNAEAAKAPKAYQEYLTKSGCPVDCKLNFSSVPKKKLLEIEYVNCYIATSRTGGLKATLEIRKKNKLETVYQLGYFSKTVVRVSEQVYFPIKAGRKIQLVVENGERAECSISGHLGPA